MSTNLQTDPELMRLRNELLTGLNKKPSKCEPNEFSNGQKKDHFDDEDDDDDEDELRKLRLEALNAKRNSSNTKRKTAELKPGRFRYDIKEESEDEDEFEDYDYRRPSSLRRHDSSKEEPPEGDNDENDADNSHQQPSGDMSMDEAGKGQIMSYRNNYEAYRFECSKLIANVAYEPNSLSNQVNISCANFDLRKFLRDKALKQESNYQKYEIGGEDKEETSTGEDKKDEATTRLGLNDIEYVYEPITRPITIENNAFFRHNQFNGRNCPPRRVRSEHDVVAFNNKKTDDDQDEDEDDESDLRNKRLKSVVVTKVVNNSNSCVKETVKNQNNNHNQSVYSSSSSWRATHYSSSSSGSSSSNHHYHRKRKKSNCSTSSR